MKKDVFWFMSFLHHWITDGNFMVDVAVIVLAILSTDSYISSCGFTILGGATIEILVIVCS